MLRKFGIVMIAAAFVTMLGVASASAATNTVSIGAITLTNRILITVPVTFVCDPLPSGPAVTSAVSVSVQQAVAQSVSFGFNQVSSGFPNSTTPVPTCDGVTKNTVNVPVTAAGELGSGPFHGGGAIVSASFQAFDAAGNSDSGSLGPIPVKLR